MKKSVITLLIFLIMIISVSAVSAADDAPDLGASDDATISVANTDTAVTAGKDVKNFTELQSEIQDHSVSGQFTLSSDYKRNTTETGAIAIGTNMVIDGNGSIINGTTAGANVEIFHINNGASVTLKNMVLYNKDYAFITQEAGTSLTLENIVFNGDITAIESHGELNVKNCVYNNNNMGSMLLYEGAKLTSPSTINVTANCNPWNQINYEAVAYDDKGNKILIGNGVVWTVDINNEKVSTHGHGSIIGNVDAKLYGKQVINATNNVLTNPTINTATVTVTPGRQQSNITITYVPTSPVWGDEVNITVTIAKYDDATVGVLYPSGKVNLTINGGTPIAKDLVNGSAVYTIPSIAAGPCTLQADYDGDDFFNPNYAIKNFDVAKKVPLINITVDNSTVGQPVISVALPSDVSGYVNITIVGTTQKINAKLEAGKTTFTPTLPASDSPYTVNVTFIPDNSESNYVTASNSTKFITAKLTSNITIAVENITYGNNASFTITLADGIKNATVVVVKEGTTEEVYNQTVNLTSGSKTITLPVLAAGKYTITVTSADNDPIYRVSTNSTLFEIKQIKSDIEIVTGEYVLFENVTVTVTVNNNKKGNVTLYDGTNVIGNKALDKDGAANFTIPAITVGKHTITAEFKSVNSNYTSNSENITIDVAKLTPKITVVLDGKVNPGQNAKINVTLTNNGTANAPTGKILISNGGLTIGQGDLDKGAVQILIPTTVVGPYSIDVFYADGDKNYTANSTTFQFEVTHFDLELKVDVENFTVDQKGVLNVTAVTAGTRNFTNPFTVEVIGVNNDLINSTYVELEPNAIKSLTYKLPAGEYKLKVTYGGDSIYYGNTTTSEVFIVKDIIRNITIEVKNVTYPGKAVAVVNASVDGDYNVTVDNKSYTVNVKNGIGQKELDILAPKEYTITVVSLIKGYETANNETNFTVEKGTINATLTIGEITYPANATAIVTANVDGVYNITDAADNIIASVTVKDGNGNVILPQVGAGTYTYKLVATVNANYTAPAKEINATFTVNKGTIDVSASVDVVKYPNKPIVMVKSSVDGVYEVFVNGVKSAKTITVVNGTGNVTLDDKDYTPKDYLVEVKMTNENYTPAKANATITVVKGNLAYNVTFTNLVYNGVDNVTGTLNTAVNAADKSYEIFFEGKNITKVKDNGDKFNLGLLAAGEYTVKVVPNATDAAFVNYNVDNYTTTFTVKTGSISLTITVVNVVYPDPVKVNITTDVATKYTVTAGTITKEVNLTKGSNIVEMGVLPVKAYTATVTSNNANYTTTTNSTAFRVTYGDIVATIDIPTVTYGTQPVATITSVNTTGTFYVKVNDKTYTVEVVNGTGNVTLDKEVFYVGTYTAQWNASIPDYNPFLGTPKTFTVDPAYVNLTIEVTTVKYPDQAVATVYANIPGVYKVTVAGYSYNVTVDDTGIKNQTIDLLAVQDNYEATVNIAKVDGNYTANEAKANFNVTIGTPVINIDVKDTYQVLENVTVTINVPYGTGKVNITDSRTGIPVSKDLVNGTCKYNITNVEGFGTHVIYVELLGDHNFTNAIKNAKFNVTKIATGFVITDNKAVYENDVVITVNMTGLVNGTAPTGQIIVPGYPAKDANKTLTFELGKLAAGDYSINITYAGDAYYDACSEVYSFTVQKFTPTVNATSTGAIHPGNATVTFISNRTGNFTIDIVDAKGNVITKEVGIVANNTKKVVQIAGLDAGKYTAKVNYLGDENYTAVTANTTFAIIKEIAEMNATVIPATYPAKATVEVIATQSGSCTVVVIDKNGKVVDTQIGSLVANVTTSVVLGQIAAGDYKVNVTYESDNYAANSVVRNLTISKGVPTITITTAGATYPAAGSVNITSDADGAFTLSIDGKVVASDNITAGKVVTVDAPKLDAGTHNVTVLYAANENYTEASAVKDLVISKGTPEIFMNVTTEKILENATLLVYIPGATGTVTIINKDIALVYGFAAYNVGILQAGPYYLTAVYSGDENYAPANKTLIFTVDKLPANLVVTVENTTYGIDPAYKITFDDKEETTIGLYIDGYEQFEKVVNGTKSGYIRNLHVGIHNSTIVYPGSNVYEAQTVTTLFNIAKADVTLSITANDVTYPSDVVVSVKSDIAGNYSVFLGTASPIYVTLEANVAQDVVFKHLAVGTYEFTLAYVGSGDYNAATKSVNVTVNKVENTTMAIDATSPVAGENATITVTLPADATGTVEVKYGNGVYTAPVEDGVAIISVPTDVAGTETAAVKYSGDNNYAAASGEVTITVEPSAIIIAENIKRGVNSPYDYLATLVDAKGQPISGLEVTFTIDGKTYKAITNASGIATVSAGLGLVNDTDTVYNVIITNPYTLENVTATTTIVPRLIVISGDLTADYLENPPYVVQAIGDDGNPVGANQTVRVVFAGFYYDLQTNATGHVVRTIGLAPGMYAVKACYEGYNTTATIFKVKQVMKVTSGTLKKTAKSYTLKATLKSSNGKAIVGKEVKLTFNGKTYTAKTNSKGVASVTIKSSVISKLQAGKTYVLKAKYVNDVAKGKIRVVKK